MSAHTGRTICIREATFFFRTFTFKVRLVIIRGKMLQNGYNPHEFLVRFRYRPIIIDKILISNLPIWLHTKNQTYESGNWKPSKNTWVFNFNYFFGKMSPVNKRQMCINWQAQIHATSSSLVISNFATSGSKIRETWSSWK